MVTDTIADMLTRIRNASLVRHRIVPVLNTKVNLAISKTLKEEGYIEQFEVIKEAEQKHKCLLITLKYKKQNRQPIINMIKRVSKPGLRIYVNHKNLPNVLGNLGTAILSTSKGVMTNHTARSLGLGGEVICYIW